jgi:hypothetical protein
MDALWSGTLGEWSEPRVEARPRPGRRPARAAEPAGDLAEPDRAAASVERMPVEVIRSPKRRKSVSARVVDGRIVVRMPTWMTKQQEREYVTELVARLERQRDTSVVDLTARAASLARRYGLPRPRAIRFVSNQTSRWGSCTPSTAEIRISDRIAGFPSWVVDAVIVHELAHLVHLHHGPEFRALMDRYPKAERAYGYLIAKQLTDDEVDPG